MAFLKKKMNRFVVFGFKENDQQKEEYWKTITVGSTTRFATINHQDDKYVGYLLIVLIVVGLEETLRGQKNVPRRH